MITASIIRNSPDMIALLGEHCVVRSINGGHFAHEKHIAESLAQRPALWWLFLYTALGHDITVFVPHHKVKHLLIKDALRTKKYQGREIGPGWQFSLRQKDDEWILKVSNNKDYVDVADHLGCTTEFNQLLANAGIE